MKKVFYWLIVTAIVLNAQYKGGYGQGYAMGATPGGNTNTRTLVVVSPRGGILYAGNTKTLYWVSSGITNVNLYYSLDSGLTYLTIASSVTASNGNYNLTVPNVSTTRGVLKITASDDTTVFAVSPVFSISTLPVLLTAPFRGGYGQGYASAGSTGTGQNPGSITFVSPQGGKLYSGLTSNLYWLSTGVTLLNIFFSQDSGTTFSSVAGNVAASNGTYAWTVPNVTANYCRLKLVAADDNSVQALSPVFSVGAVPVLASAPYKGGYGQGYASAAGILTNQTSLTLTSPNGGESYITGRSTPVTWSSSGVDSVNLYYSTNNGTNWTMLAGYIPASAGTFTWTIPQTASTQYLVKVVSTSDTTLYDVSNATFTVSLPRMLSSTKNITFGTNTYVMDSTNVSLSFYLKSTGLLTSTYYPDETPATGTLPTGILKASQYYWVLSSTAGSLTNGYVTVPLSSLRGVTNPNAIVWLKRGSSGQAWTNIGGAVIDGALKNTTSFSSLGEFAIGSSDTVANPLPVELINFISEVRGKEVRLRWITATEINNTGFEVQRSKDSKGGESLVLVWEKAGYVEGSGNSNSPKEYGYTDKMKGYGKYLYRLKSISNDGASEYSSIISADLGKPAEYRISQNYPNPFNPETKIDFDLPEATKVRIEVYNILGKLIGVVKEESMEAGSHTVSIDGRNLPSGMYVYRITTGKYTKTMKMLLLK